MLNFRMLGGIAIGERGAPELDALLRQPKHVALLAYLATPRVGSWHRRDAIVGTFWSDLDQLRARASLRSALYILRRQLPPETIVARGADELSLNPALIETDVATLHDHLAHGRYADVLTLHTGELLPGLFISDAPAFDSWLDAERSGLRTAVVRACTALAEQFEKAGDLTGALDAARRGFELQPDDEAAVRRWITLLDRSGDRAQAFAVYERFRDHLSAAFGIRPSAETVALLDAVRTRREVHTAPSADTTRASSQTAAVNGATSDGDNTRMLPLTGPGASSFHSHLSEESNAALPLGTTEAHAGLAATAVSHSPPVARYTHVQAAGTAQSPPRWRSAAILVGSLSVLVIVAALIRRPASWSAVTPATFPETKSIVVLPMRNATGDSAFTYIAEGMAGNVAHRLEGIGGITIRIDARGVWSDSAYGDLRATSRAYGIGALLKTSLHRAGDSLEVRASVVDAVTLGERTIASVPLSPRNLVDAESRLAASLAAALFRVSSADMPRRVVQSIDSASYRLTVEGFRRLFSVSVDAPSLVGTRAEDARPLFELAVSLDEHNARAWAGLSSVYSSIAVSGAGPFDVNYDKMRFAADRALVLDSLEGTALANLAIMRALKNRDLTIGLKLMQLAEAAEPSNPEVFLVKSVMLRNAHRYDEARDAIRVARQLDPLTPYWLNREAIVAFCEDRPDRALQLFESEQPFGPADTVKQTGFIRALAMLGRYDRAIIGWQEFARFSSDSALLDRLSRVSPDSTGYWTVRHEIGRETMKKSLARMRAMNPFYMMQLSFRTGAFDEGFRYFDAALKTGTHQVYRLSCLDSVDEIRHTPRFADAVKRAGALQPH